MSEDKRTTAASFKLETLETIAADPVMKPIDHALLGAYMKFMKWPARTAYLTNITARIMTGMVSEPTITASRARMVKYGYLKRVMAKLNGAIVYEINNPRADIVADHIVSASEKLKEMDAYRRECDRRRQAAKEGAKKTLTPDEQGGQRNLGDSTKETYDNSLEEIPGSRAPKEEPPLRLATGERDRKNTYASAKDGEDPDAPYPAPRNEAELEEMLSQILDGIEVMPAVLKFFRTSLADGKLTPAMVEQQRRFAA